MLMIMQITYNLTNIYQVIDAVVLNHTRRQWVDMGNLTEIGMAHSDTCGAAGGAIILWVENYKRWRQRIPWHHLLSDRSQQSLLHGILQLKNYEVITCLKCLQKFNIK